MRCPLPPLFPGSVGRPPHSTHTTAACRKLSVPLSTSFLAQGHHPPSPPPFSAHLCSLKPHGRSCTVHPSHGTWYTPLSLAPRHQSHLTFWDRTTSLSLYPPALCTRHAGPLGLKPRGPGNAHPRARLSRRPCHRLLGPPRSHRGARRYVPPLCEPSLCMVAL